jgi:surface antigen
MKKLSLLFISALLATSACAPQYGPGQGVGGTGISKQQAGTVLGAIGGGIIGSNVGKGKGQTAATIGGALLGAMAGGSIGESLDRADMMYLNNSTQGALEGTTTGTVSRWINPDSGNSGTVTPTRTFQNSTGQYCREFSQAIVVGGQTQNAFGTACRQNDGSWKIVNQQ